jgi:hypothetical protein
MNLSRGVLGETEGFGSFCAMGNDPVNKVDPLGLATKVYSDDGNTLILISGGWVIGKYQKDASGNWCQLRGVGGGLDTSAISLGDVGMMTSEGAHGMVMAPVNLVVGGYNLVSGIGTYSGNLSVDASGTWNQTVNIVQALPGAVPGMLEQVASDPKAIGGIAGDAMLGFGIAKVAQAGKLAQLSKVDAVIPEEALSTWKNLPGGVRIKKVGNYWIKEVDPDASSLAQWWGRGSLEAQAKGLAKLDDMAPSYLYKNSKLITRDVGSYEGGQFWRTWYEGSKRLGTPMNDIRPRNIGANGMIFDPALHPVQQGLYWTAGGLGGIWGGYQIYGLLTE